MNVATLLSAFLGLSAVGDATLVRSQGPARLTLRAEKVQDGKAECRLSDRLTLTLEVRGRPVPEGEVTLVDAADDWEVRAGKPRAEAGGDGGTSWRLSVELAPRRAGDLTLQPEPLRLGGRTLNWEPIPVRVTTEVQKADVSELRDNLPPEELPPEPGLPGWLIGPALGVLLAGTGTAVWLLRRQRAAEVLPVSPEEWAAAELERIERMNLPAAGQGKRYHTLLAGVVRRHVELRHQIPARRRTTAEFLRAVAARSLLPPERQAVLGEFLQRCDRVKFGGAATSPEDCQKTAELARALVREPAQPPPGFPGESA